MMAFVKFFKCFQKMIDQLSEIHCDKGPGSPVSDQMNVLYMEQSLFLIISYTRTNMKSILYYLIQIQQFKFAKQASAC